MSLKRVSPQEARELMQTEGYVYVDVRSIPEFDAGHPEGAYNVPLLHMGSHGMSPNPEFLDVMQRHFTKDAKLVLGCKAGGRSLQAAGLLASSGFTNVVDQRAGFEGAGGPGGVSEPGWRPAGLPVSTQAGAGRAYEALKAKPR
jgi:rhodanese-related sulfurtransferase